MSRNPYAPMIFMLAIAGGLAALLVHPPAGFPLGPIPAAQGVLLFSMFLLLFLPMTEMRPSAKNGPRQVFGQLQFQIVFFVFLFTAQIPQPEESLLGFLQRLWGFILLGPWIVLVWMGFHLLAAAYRLRHRRLINWRKTLNRIALKLAGSAAFALLLGLTGWASPATALWAGIIVLGLAAASPWVQDQTRRYSSGRARVPALAFLAVAANMGAMTGLYATLEGIHILRALFIFSGVLLVFYWQMNSDRRKQALRPVQAHGSPEPEQAHSKTQSTPHP